MSYIIDDLYHKLVIRLVTDIANKSDIKLSSYVNGALHHDYNPIIENGILKYVIPNKDYNVGDDISFKVKYNGERKLEDLNGIVILVDGEEYSTITSSDFPVQFYDGGLHSVQAVYVGTKDIGSAFSNIVNVRATQTIVDDSPTPVRGVYTLTMDAPTEVTYLTNPNIVFTLKKDGVPVSGAVIEKVYPYVSVGDVWTGTTDINGQSNSLNLLNSTLRKWDVGEYWIGARYYKHFEPEADRFTGLICKVFKKMKIIKATPKLKITNTPKKKKDSMKIKLTNHLGEELNDVKITYTLNGKSKSKKTNKYGNITIPFTNKGTYNYKIVSASSKNYNTQTLTGSVVIS